MAAGKTAGKNSPGTGKSTNAVVEKKVVALAEQLGWFLGTARAKADGWLESDKVRKELGRIRDGAAELLQHIEAASRSAHIAARSAKSAMTAAAAKPAAAAATPAAAAPRPSRGPVDAPGKRHRKPPPQETLPKHMGEAVGKKMGQKSFQVGKSRGRG